jgi:HK97 family phage portal protein
MALIDRIKQLFTKASYQDTQNNGKLPFIMLMGTEKAYGKPQPNDYSSMVANYKSWAYACAWKNATSVAKCKVCLYKPTYDNKKEKKDLVEIEEHPFLDLMKSVNPFSNAFELKTITAMNMDLTGNAYWYLPKGPLGIPEMIWNIPSHWVKIVPSTTNFIDGYVVTVPGKPAPIPFDESEIVHFKYPSPSDLFYGAGPLWAARVSIDLSNQIKEWGVSFFMNNAQPSGILTTDNSLTSDQYQRLRDQWNEKYRGVKNAGKMAFLEGGLKYQQMGSNVRDASFSDTSREIRDEILACFGVPASKLGLVEDVNRANADANDYTYQKETILPRLALIEEKINEKIIPMYDTRLIMKFENPVPEDREFKLKERQTNIQIGYSSIDELRVEDGLDPWNLPETEVPLIPFSLTPAGTPKADPMLDTIQNNIKSIDKSKADSKWEKFAKVTHTQEKAMQAMMKRYFQSQHSEVMQKLNNFKAVQKDLYASILFNMNEANSHLKNISRSYVKKAYITGLTLGMNDTGSVIDFDLFNPNIVRAVEQRVGFFAIKTNETTAKLLSDELSQGLSQGESISDIAKRVDKVFSYREDFSSTRTARTEVIGATNDGQLASYIEAGIEQKEWITARDEKVRDSHQIDGQIVDTTQSFVTGQGSHLRYPGDRSSGADASDLVNCRCTMLPVIKTKGVKNGKDS